RQYQSVRSMALRPAGYFRRPDYSLFARALYCAHQGHRRGARMALTILCISFVILLILGVPVAFAIGLSAVCTILYEGLPIAVLFQQMMSGMNIFSFLAIPSFVFTGGLMLHGGIADKTVTLAHRMIGHTRGGLGMAKVIAS